MMKPGGHKSSPVLFALNIESPEAVWKWAFSTIVVDDINDVKIMVVQYMSKYDFLGIKAFFWCFVCTVFLGPYGA